MAIISEQTYTGNGSQREFQVDGTILSDSHIGVWFVVGGVETRQDTSTYDILGSVVLFNVAPANGVSIRLLLSDTGQDLDVPPSAISGVYANLTAILAVEANEANINIVATDIQSVIDVATDIANVNTVAGDMQSVLDVAANLATVAYFADTYYKGATAPTVITHPTLDTGDLWYDTVNKILYEYNGTSWVIGYTGNIEAATMTLTNKTLDNITNFIGADHVHYACRNASGTPISSGTVVTAQGTQSGTDYIEIVPVTDPQTQIALGILHGDLANNATGLVINTGLCTDHVDTSAWTVGTILYPNSSAGLTDVKPASGWYQACAVVLRSHANQGTLLIEFTEPKYIASTTQSGYVQLNDTLTSTSTTEALTAAKGKVLQDDKLSKNGGGR